MNLLHFLCHYNIMINRNIRKLAKIAVSMHSFSYRANSVMVCPFADTKRSNL